MPILDSKCKKCRRAGEKLFLKGERCNTAKCAIVKRNYPPGAHGVKGAPRLSEYGRQLKEKQKAKRIYGIVEKQCRKYYVKAIGKKGNTGELFSRFLEKRFDNVIFRLGLASSRTQARQMVSHGFFKVNDKKVNIPSYEVKNGDIISIKKEKVSRKPFEKLDEKLKSKELPSWLSLDLAEMKGKVISDPRGDDLKMQFDPTLIVEFYSR